MVEAGQVYKHFKGSLYQIIGVAKHSETLELMVVYFAISNPEQYWVRPYDMFVEVLLNGKRRFELKS